MKEVEVRSFPVALTKEQREELKKIITKRKNPFKPVTEEPEVIEEGENNG